MWFAQSKGDALRRAKVKARGRRDLPVVLVCDVDLAALRRRHGGKRVVYRAGIVSIDGSLPVTVLRHAPGVWDPRSWEPELAAWLNMLGDEEHTVRRTALELIARSEDGDPHLLVPFACCSHKGLRSAAVAGMAHLGGEDAAEWCTYGLRDPDDAVRIASARELTRFDPRHHRRLFELALYDPNPQVAEMARKLSAHQGYHVQKPRWN